MQELRPSVLVLCSVGARHREGVSIPTACATPAPPTLPSRASRYRFIQQQLGHASLHTTTVHLRHIAPVELVETMKRRNWNP